MTSQVLDSLYVCQISQYLNFRSVMEAWDALHQVRSRVVSKVTGYIAYSKPAIALAKIAGVLVRRLVEKGNLFKTKTENKF